MRRAQENTRRWALALHSLAQDMVGVLESTNQLKKVQKGALLEFLESEKAFASVHVHDVLPKLRESDLFHVIADNRDIESKLSMRAVVQVVKRAGRHAAVMRFSRPNLLRLFAEARLVAYLSPADIVGFAHSMHKRVNLAPGKSKSPAKLKALRQFNRRELCELLTRERLTEKMPHGALVKAVRQMSRVDAVACVGASDLRRILAQQGLLKMVRVEHIVRQLQPARLLRILRRDSLDAVIRKFGLSVSTEEMISRILESPADSSDGGDKSTQSLNTLQAMLSSLENARLVRMDVTLREVALPDGKEMQEKDTSRTESFHKSFSIYGVVEANSCLLRLCNVNPMLALVCHCRRELLHNAQARLLDVGVWESKSGGLTLIVTKSDGTCVILPHYITDDEAVATRKSRATSGARSSRASSATLRRSWAKHTAWIPPIGTFRHRENKLFVRVENYSDTRLLADASRSGLVPSQDQWNMIQRTSKDDLVRVFTNDEKLSSKTPTRLLVHVADDDALVEAISSSTSAVHCAGHDASASGPVPRDIIRCAVPYICRLASETGFCSIAEHLGRNIVLQTLESSGAYLNLSAKDWKGLCGLSDGPEWWSTLESLDKANGLGRRLSLPDVCKAAERMSARDALRVLLQQDPRRVLGTSIRCSLAEILARRALLRSISRQSLLGLLRGCDGADIMRAFKYKLQRLPVICTLTGLSAEDKHRGASVIPAGRVSNTPLLLRMAILTQSGVLGGVILTAIDPGRSLCWARFDSSNRTAFCDGERVHAQGGLDLVLWDRRLDRICLILQKPMSAGDGLPTTHAIVVKLTRAEI